jgi:dTDP-4-dehydrorhamnose reductase
VCDTDPAATTALNVDATRAVVDAARESGAWVLYISTDYVFDGTRPPYRIDDPTNPINHYGRTKLQGEVATLQSDPQNCALRIPILYGLVESLDESPVTILARDVRDPRPKLVEHWATRFPTHADDVAVVCRQIVLRRIEDPGLAGIFHWRGGEALTKYEMAVEIARALGLSAAHLSPDDRPPAGAPRPKNTMLDCSRLEALGIGRRTPFLEGIAEALRKLS